MDASAEKPLSEPAQSFLDHCLRSEGGGRYDLSNWDGRQFPTWISSDEKDRITRALNENGYLVDTVIEHEPCGCRPCCNWNRNSYEDLGDPCPGYREKHWYVVKATLARRFLVAAERWKNGIHQDLDLKRDVKRRESRAREAAEREGEAVYRRCLSEMEDAARRQLRRTVVRLAECVQLDGGSAAITSETLPAEEEIRLHRFAVDHARALLTADGTVSADWRYRRGRSEETGEDAYPAYTVHWIEMRLRW